MNNSLDLDALDTLWKARQAKTNTHDLERFLEALTRETNDVSARYELDWRRARLFHFAAMKNLESGDEQAARMEFERGADRAQWTLTILDRGEGRFWHAVNFLEWARRGSKWNAFWALRGVQAQLQSVAEWDEAFHFAGAHRVLGRIAHLAPRRAGGDARKAQRHFERALQIADNSTTRLYFAELLSDLGATGEAKWQIEAILSAPDDANWVWEQARDRKRAREWVERLG